MARIRIGTCSWTDKPLVESGAFYPAEAKSAEAMLRYYASQFDFVEVDSSYYAISQPRNAELWVQRTPDDFVFDLKAFRLFTLHQTNIQVFAKAAARRQQAGRGAPPVRSVGQAIERSREPYPGLP